MADHRLALWEVMQKARDAAMASNHPFATDEQLAAAEIRAMRDWLVPEEPHAPDTPDFPNGVTIRPFYMWAQRREIRAKLTAEADRADRGEGANG